MARYQTEVSVLGQILLFQSAIYLVRDEKILAEMAVHGLSDIPGISKIQFLVEHDVLAETAVEHTPDGTQTSAGGAGRPMPFPLRTSKAEYGRLIFEVTDFSRFEPYAPFASNTANLIALQIENWRIDVDLETANARLSRLADERADRYRELFEGSRDALMTVAPPDWHFTTANRAALALFAAESAAHLSSVEPWQVSPEIQPDGRPSEAAAREMISTAMAEGSHSFEWLHRTFAGREFMADVLLARLDTADGPLIQATVRDITERKRMETALRISEERLRRVSDNADVGLLRCSRDLTYLSANPAYAKIAGKPLDQIVGRSIGEVIGAEAMEAIRPNLERVLRGEPLTCEVDVPYAHSGRRFLHIRYTPEIEPCGAVVGFIGSVTDITDQRQMREALAASEALYRGLFEAESDAIVVIDVKTMRCIDANAAAAQLYGYTQQEILEKTVSDLSAEPERSAYGFHARQTNIPIRWHRRKDGTRFPVEITSSYFDLNGRSLNVSALRDITTRKLAEDQMRITAKIFDRSGEAIMVVGADLRIQAVNPAFTAITGYSAGEAIGQTTKLLKSGRQGGEFYRQMWSAIHDKGFWQGEIWNRRKDGAIYPEWLTISRIENELSEVEHYVGVFSDITQLHESQRKAEFLATHDTLTSLPNRSLFHDRLEHAMAQARRKQNHLALMFIDLDNFKNINDTSGHHLGDELLVQVASRLQTAVRDVDTVARVGGDEFTAVVTSCTEESAREVAVRIVEALGAPYTVQDGCFYISASVGIALYPQDGDDAGALIKAADAAMYRAKERGRNRIEFYVSDLHRQLIRHTVVERGLRGSLQQNLLRLVFQPKFSLGPVRSVTGAEALLRWRDPELGDISPGEFIPIAEASGLIMEIDRTVRKLVLGLVSQWRADAIPVPRIAINVSPRTIREPSFAGEFLADVAASSVSPELLQVEITEGALLENTDAVVQNVKSLAAAGIGISIDDFGTGYSSLAYLKRLPLTELKIDRSFVLGLAQQREDKAITRAVLALAEALELTSVAEGVETAGQLEMLTTMGCDAVQGFLLAQPMEADEFARFVQQGH